MDTQNALTTLADSHDDALILTWLQTKQSDNTRRAYTRIVNDFMTHVDKPLQTCYACRCTVIPCYCRGQG